MIESCVRAPSATIGMPVRNGSAYISRAIESLLSQTFGDFELIVCDNASTDATVDIADAYARQDERVRIYRGQRNRGAPANFHRALRHARGAMFMWASHDDEWSPEFIAMNARALEKNRELIASVSRVRVTEPSDRSGGPGSGMFSEALTRDTFALRGSPADNVKAYLRHPGANSRIYSLYRTEVLRLAVVPRTFWGFDWWWVVRTLAHGGYYELDEPLLTRRPMGESQRDRPATIDRYNRGFLGSAAPMMELTRRLLAEPHVPRDAWTIGWLLRKNIKESGVTAFDRAACRVPLVRGPLTRARQRLRRRW